MRDKLRNYYRQKRIRRILSFYHDYQPSNFDGKAYKKVPIISRDARIHFVLTSAGVFFFGKILSLIHFPGTFSFIVAGFLAVEAADYILIRGVKLFDRVFDYILPIGAFIVILALVYGQKEFRLIETFRDNVMNFRERYNNDIQSRPKLNVADSGSGDNWMILGFEKGSSHPLTLQEAINTCSSNGKGWSLYDGNFQFSPPLLLKSAQYFWVKNMPGQMGPGEPVRPSGWIAPKQNEKALAICVRRGP